MQEVENKNYLAPFISLFIISSLFLTIFSISVSYIKIMQVNQGINKENLENEISNKIQDFKILFENEKQLLKTLSNSYIFQEFIDKKTQNHNVIDLLKSVSSSNGNIMQLRYLDEFGNEIIRIDRDKIHSNNISVIESSELQNKEHRYYFQETINKNKDQFYISNLDLNMENGKIEIPLNPVIRIGVPVFDKYNYKRGILIINVFMEYYLEKLVNSKLFKVYIFDDEYFSLYTNDEYFRNFEKYLSENSNTLLKNKNLEKKVLLETSDEKLYIALESIKPASLKEHIYTILSEILFIVIPISLILAFILSRIPKALLKKIDEDHTIILSQSKQSAVSEMIVMIAHQWRQPLTVISLIAQEIIFSHKLDMLDKKTTDKLGNQLLEKIDSLSKSIDDFRDFFRNDDIKVDFDLLSSANEIKQIMQSNLDELGIEFTIHDENFTKESRPFRINSYKTSFSQVLINLLSNSIHAIEDNCNLSEKRKIDITVSRRKKLIEVSIEDTGKGIKAQNINKIFDLYYSSDKEILQGKGLGLYFVKNIVDTRFKGSIKAENKEHGARFTISIPV